MKYKCIFMLLICFIDSFLFPCLAWCKHTNFTVVTATSENIINTKYDKQYGIYFYESQFARMANSSGGAVLEAMLGDYKPQSSIIHVSFGQPFAGRIFNTTAIADLDAEADRLMAEGSAFLDDDDIFRSGILDKSDGTPDYDHLTKDGKETYDEEALINAEEYYRRVLNIDPFSEEAVEGIIKARLARVHKGNLVWDMRRREQLRLRLTKVGVLGETGAKILRDEINILNEISEIERASIALLMDLYSEPDPHGPGGLLRGKFTISNSDIAKETLKLIYSTARRFETAELALGQKRMLLNFFNQGNSGDENSRAFAVRELENASVYVTEIVRLMNPYWDDEFYENSDALVVSNLQSKVKELVSLMNQGYNPFGFLNDFVPFVSADEHDKNLYTFDKMYDIASEAVTITARSKEEHARQLESDFLRFAQTEGEYRVKFEETESSYTQRLKSLVGTVDVDGEEEPDIYTFLYPDKDVDNEGKTERDRAREKLAEEEGFLFKAKGQIAEQYLIIASSEKRVDQAFNEIENVFKQIEILEETGRRIAGLLEAERKAVFTITMAAGEKVGLKIREKGKLEKIAADRQHKRNMWFGVLGALTGGAASVASAIPSKKSSVDVSSVSQTQESHTELSPKPKEVVTAVIAISAAVAATVVKIVDLVTAPPIQGQLAVDLADVDAQINEINYMSHATIESIKIAVEKQIEMERTLQSVRLAALEKANKEFNYVIAQRDLQREQMSLVNKISEAGTLIADLENITHLLQRNEQNITLGWVEGDARDVLTNNVLIADQSLFRAQVWTFVALRALEYYANKPPQANGQPDTMIKSLYERLYSARRTEDLSDLLLEMKAKAESDFVFTIGTTSCGERGLLSIKYDVLVPTLVNYRGNGQPEAGGVNKEDKFRYLDPNSGEFYEGARAYQAVFRDALRQGITGIKPKRELKLVFATDLYPREFTDGVIGDNPFFVRSAITAKIIGFTNSNCAGVGVEENVQGIQVNFTGNFDNTDAPSLNLAQRGNSYLKHTQWDNNDFDDQLKLIQPLKNITVYSAYKQILPTWLIGDINLGTNETEDTIGSAVIALFKPLLNGQGPAGKALAFTDRAVSNDSWELIIDENETAQNLDFFSKLDQMLANPIPEDIWEDFLTDIQLWIGWAFRNPNANFSNIQRVD